MTKLDKKRLVIHHRRPQSRGGGSQHRNLARVPHGKHEAWHTLFANFDPQTIAKIISDDWIDPDFYMVAIPRHKVVGKRHKKKLVAICSQCGTRCELHGIPVAILKGRV